MNNGDGIRIKTKTKITTNFNGQVKKQVMQMKNKIL